MSGINKVILVGNLGKDPEVFTFENGTKRVRINVATTEVRKGRNQERIEHTEWHNVVFYGNLAEVAAKYLHKGEKVYLEGSIRSRSWEDAGVRKYFSEIEGNQLLMLSTRKADETPAVIKGSPADMSPPPVGEDEPIFDPDTDQLPF